jgi:hypothetical protein
LWLVSFPNEVKCLCCFLLQTAAGSGSAADSALSIQTGKKAETAVLRIGGVQNVGNALGGPDGSPSDNSETGRSTLLLDACKSIAVRLDARIHVENEPNRPAALVVEFPLELS